MDVNWEFVIFHLVNLILLGFWVALQLSVRR